MGYNRGQIKTNVRVNLNDAGVTFYSDTDLNESFQDAYDDVACLSQCIVKIADNQQFLSDLSYYNFVNDLLITDYLGTVAIFNYNTNRWLRDDLTLRDADRIRRDWELWVGTPQFWSSSDPLHVAIYPKYSNLGAFWVGGYASTYYIATSATPLFKLVYWAQAPALVDDSSVFLTATDVQNLFEFYVTADMLETAEEYTKASAYWTKYYDSLAEYSMRVKRNNKSDLLLRV